ncbi:MAG: molybdenum cofactor biosynthesis protein MoaE [Candidatus Ranarchaeia archaeon]|jgi:molybdopterin synthase catalytic subunit
MSEEQNHQNLVSGVHPRGEITLEAVMKDVKKHPKIAEAGAIGVFVGLVRERDGEPSKESARTTLLELEAWEEEANNTIQKICTEEGRTKGILQVQIHHALGKLEPQEDIVYVVVAGAHRNEVFDTLRRSVERYKHEAPIWKKEHSSDGDSRWVSTETIDGQ